MSRKGRDRNLDNLLDLDGQVLFVDPAGKYWVKFSVKKVDTSPERPHGLSYSLTLHDRTGRRLVGFDNAYPVRASSGPGKKKGKEYDHKHRFRTIKPYEYKDSAALLADFWLAVDTVLKKEGII